MPSAETSEARPETCIPEKINMLSPEFKYGLPRIPLNRITYIIFLGVVILLLNGYFVDKSAARERNESNVLVSYGQSGGIAGLSLWSHICKDGRVLSGNRIVGQLTSEELDVLKGMFETKGFLSLADDYSPSATVYDSMSISITYFASARKKTVTVSTGGNAPPVFSEISQELYRIWKKFYKEPTSGQIIITDTATFTPWPLQNELKLGSLFSFEAKHELVQPPYIPDKVHQYFITKFYDIGKNNIDQLDEFQRNYFNSSFGTKVPHFYLEGQTIYEVTPLASWDSYKKMKIISLQVDVISTEKWPISGIELSSLRGNGLHVDGDVYLAVKDLLGYRKRCMRSQRGCNYFFEGTSLVDSPKLYAIDLDPEPHGKLVSGICEE